MRSTLPAILLLAATLFAHAGEHCDNLPRPANAALERQAASTDWFDVSAVGDGVYALLEPYQWQTVYPGTIWLFDPAHNVAVSRPDSFVAMRDAFEQVMQPDHPTENGQ